MPETQPGARSSVPEVGQPLHLPGAETFGPYRLAGLIGRGGMAELLLAFREQHAFRQVVALKRVLPEFTDAHLFAQLFAQEAALTARLEHPNIVRVVDFGEVDGRAFLAMEYLAGEDLARILKRYGSNGARMPVRMAVEVARGMAAGLAHAHALCDEAGRPLHLVHRDVTPANVVVTYHGVVKLVDFGIAKATSNALQTRTGTIKGKLAYIAPEVYELGAVDARTDVYSLGCVLWEMLAGARPYEAPNEAALMGAILRGQPPALRSVAPEVDEALAALCVRAMARDPAERFQTAAALEEALEHWLGSTGGQLGARPIAQWMVALFGSESAAAKLDVAAGSRVSAVLPLVLAAPARLSPLRAPERVTPEPSLEVSVSEAVSMTALRRQAAPARPGRHGRSWWLALGAGAVLATLAWLWALRVAPASAPDAAGPTGTLVVASSPTGAAVFVDGAPIGRVTPTRLSRLVPGRAITILVQLAGYEPSERQVAPVEGEHVEQFSLSPSGGRR